MNLELADAVSSLFQLAETGFPGLMLSFSGGCGKGGGGVGFFGRHSPRPGLFEVFGLAARGWVTLGSPI